MKNEYIAELGDTLKLAKKIRKIYKSWESSKTGYKCPEKGAAYKNYLLICCYGTIEKIFKNLISDYFTAEGMPQRCVRFGNDVRKKLTGSLCRDKLSKFIKEDCSEDWFNEIKRREKSDYKCKKDITLTFSDAWYAVESLTNARHAFAHGDYPYTGSIEDVVLYYTKALTWIYEIDDIIISIG